jgi:hypothetical protein
MGKDAELDEPVDEVTQYARSLIELVTGESAHASLDAAWRTRRGPCGRS